MNIAALRKNVYGLPVFVWFVLGAAAGWMLYVPPPPRDTPLAFGDEDFRTRAGGDYWDKLYGPHRARAFGLPPHMHHLCPVSWSGQEKSYPDPLGVLGVKAYPNPGDDDGIPCDEFGTQDWDRKACYG
jgi:hypothetical protein